MKTIHKLPKKIQKIETKEGNSWKVSIRSLNNRWSSRSFTNEDKAKENCNKSHKYLKQFRDY